MRKCWQCGAELRECMGSVSAGDFQKYLVGELPAEEIRETCGKCVTKHLLAEEMGEALPFPLPSEKPAT